MKKTTLKFIQTKKAPAAIGPYSQAIVVGNLVFCAGQIGIDPKTNTLRSGMQEQTKQVLRNLAAVLKAAGSRVDLVVKTTIYLKNMNDFSLVNQIYAEFFDQHKPARSTVEVANLPKGALIEIEAMATLDNRK